MKIGRYGWVLCVLWSLGMAVPVHAKRSAFFEGYELYRNGHVAEAVPYFEQAVKDQPGHAPTWSKLAACYEKMELYDKAFEAWSHYAELKKQSQETVGRHVRLIQKYQEAEKLIRAGKEEESIPLLLEVIGDRHPGSALTERSLILLKVLLKKYQRHADYVEMGEKLLREFPEQATPDFYEDYAVAQEAVRQFDGAAKTWALLRALYADEPLKQKVCCENAAWCAYRHLKECLRDRRIGVVVQELEKILQSAPEMTGEKLSEMKDALAEWRRQEVKISLSLVRQHLAEGNYRQGWEVLRGLHMENMSSEEVDVFHDLDSKIRDYVQSHQQLADGFYRTSKWLEAAAEYRILRQMDANNQGGLSLDREVFCLNSVKGYKELIQRMEEIIADKDARPEMQQTARRHLALSYARGFGDKARALGVLAEGVRQFPSVEFQKVAQLAVGEVHFFLKEEAKAREIFQQIIKQYPDDDNLLSQCRAYLSYYLYCKDKAY